MPSLNLQQNHYKLQEFPCLSIRYELFCETVVKIKNRMLWVHMQDLVEILFVQLPNVFKQIVPLVSESARILMKSACSLAGSCGFQVISESSNTRLGIAGSAKQFSARTCVHSHEMLWAQCSLALCAGHVEIQPIKKAWMQDWIIRTGIRRNY